MQSESINTTPARTIRADQQVLDKIQRKSEKKTGTRKFVLEKALAAGTYTTSIDLEREKKVLDRSILDRRPDVGARSSSLVSEPIPIGDYTKVPRLPSRSGDAHAAVGTGFALAEKSGGDFSIVAVLQQTEQVERSIGDPSESYFPDTQSQAKVFKQPASYLGPHEQGHIVVAARTARTVTSFAKSTFDYQNLTDREQRKLGRLLMKVSKSVAHRVNDDFFHPQVKVATPAEISKKTKRAEELLKNDEIEQAIRTELVGQVAKRSRWLAKYVKP